MSEEQINETETTQTESTEEVADAPAKKKAPRRPTKKSTKKKTTKKTTKKKPAAADEPVVAADEPAEAEPASTTVDSDTESPTEPATPEPEPSADTGEPEAEEPKPAKKKASRKRSTKKSATKSASDADKPATSARPKSSKDAKPPVVEMIVNYVPGEECRIAMLEDGKLEEFSTEPADQVSRVGNIYVGRVANIEQSIQAAFIDFGTEENGFLHVSDLHPQYFAKGDDKTERVGKKTPRKSRPPIQDCLKKGQEIIVQVLKEGVGTKGPSLTSYLSIPGRFLVMMPGMDKVGVSRKEEDDDKRKAAKEILSHLDLPEGFGFILRTAGFDRNKAELKRDLAYLQRLWKDMEKRRKIGSKSKPKLLYTESDLLVRSIRDLLSSEVSRVVIDSESALNRVANFIKIAAPRSGTKLAHYVGTRPIFHAFEIEPQIEEIHAREVHLPSGGRLVIDQTEALVAIDVNSGKSRGAKDAESNAFQTNLEAVDAICRQLRLRDLGGLVVNDMIDMRHASHRKEIEQRFRDRLKRDRAKSTIAPISPFGLLEMTRQRMRGSMESMHFSECPMCHGRGLAQRPDSVASSALRDLAALIDYEQVHRAELVVHSRVAGSLLSTRRKSLTRIELTSGKLVDVRVSDSLPIDRFAFYAYDAKGNDISIEKLKPSRGHTEPAVVDWLDTQSADGSWAVDPLDEADETTAQKILEELAKAHEAEAHASSAESIDMNEDIEEDAGTTKKKRRRRRRGKRSDRETEGNEQGETPPDEPKGTEDSESDDENNEHPEPENEDGEGVKKKRRRRRRGGRGRSRSDEESTNEESEHGATPEPEAPDGEQHESSEPPAKRNPRRRPPRPGSEPKESEPKAASKPDPKPEAKPAPKSEPKPSEPTKPTPEPKPARRGLYSNARRKLSASEIAKLGIDS
ncbi:MAG: Rne/Rng family ribonuclease [Phycisphaerales bacterium]|nr:Rne/Rng family ribonuclease [Phycisphaerales bacterium]